MRKGALVRWARYGALGVAIAAVAFASLLFLPPLRQANVEYRVAKGSTLARVATDLKRERVVSSSKVFSLYMRIIGADRAIKPGLYAFSPKISPVDVARKLIRGDIEAEKVVIPEGRTARQIAQILEAHGILSAGDFVREVLNPKLAASLDIPSTSCEGFLYPDTYFLEKNSNADEVIRRMVGNFRTTLERVRGAQAGSLDTAALYQKVILASIVEREYRLTEDAPLIASVFYNRLAKKMPLQSCATVVYVLTEHLGRPHPSVVYYNDLKIKDPYNTYINRGLPPGPISNPGEVSLRAAFDPAATDYLYFRLDESGSGKHRFSRTLDEHNDVALIPKGL